MRNVVRVVQTLSLLIALWPGGARVAEAGGAAAPSGLTNLYVNALAMDSSGNLYAGTTGGVFRTATAGAGPVQFWNNIGLKDLNVKSITFGKDLSGTTFIYAGTWGSGVWRATAPQSGFAQVSWGMFNDGLPNLNQNITAVVAVDQFAAYAGTAGNGVYKLVNNKWTEFKTGLTNPFVTTLSKDSTGNVYAGTYGGGVFKLSAGTTNWVALNNGLPNPLISAFAADTSGNYFYAGTVGGGVFKVTSWSTGWGAFNGGLTNVSIKALAVDTSGNVYAGVESGVYKTPSWSGSWSVYHPDLPNPDVTALLIDPAGNIYAGTAGGGVFKIPLTSWSAFN